MKRSNSILRCRRSVIGAILLGSLVLGGGCSMGSALMSSLAGAGLSVATTLISSLLTSVIPTDNTTSA